MTIIKLENKKTGECRTFIANDIDTVYSHLGEEKSDYRVDVIERCDCYELESEFPKTPAQILGFDPNKVSTP